MKKKAIYRLAHGALFSALAAVFLCVPLLEADAVLVSPKRVMFGERQRTAQIIIHNPSKFAQNITFGWERLVMKDGGQLVKLEDGQTMEGYRPVDPYIKFAPRRTILKPGESQKVRLLVQKPADLPPGEYHSHFKIMEDPVVDIEQITEEQKFKLAMMVKVAKSIPLFVYNGETKLDIKINKAGVVSGAKGERQVRLDIENNSTRSVYARVRMECQGAGAPIVQKAQTIRIYSEAKKLTKEVGLGKIDVSKCTGGLKVALMGVDDIEYKDQIIAQSAVSIK